MAHSVVHLPNGQTLTVTPVFGGLSFKANDLSTHHSIFPPGWTVILNSEDYEEDHRQPPAKTPEVEEPSEHSKHHHIHRYRRPTLQNDHLYLSSISNPSSSEFRPASSPTRQIAMMLWATLYWYFHQPEPDPRITTRASAKTADAGKPKGEWRININREGIFKGKHLFPKLERMGLISSEDSSVGVDTDERSGDGWQHMFVSRRSFWQLDARLYLFTLSPIGGNAPFPAGSPYTSRPSSPARGEGMGPSRPDSQAEVSSQGLWAPQSPTMFHSASHLPTYFPPAPAQYTFTNNVRHPVRPKPPRQGETFYQRYIPSVGQYLSFRVASLAAIQSMVPPRSVSPALPTIAAFRNIKGLPTDSGSSTPGSATSEELDVDLLHRWMNEPRVNHSWGEAGPKTHQEEFLRNGLKSKHSIPVIGCWDGRPFGYFEIYWVKEDRLAQHLGGEVDDWDRGIHCLVGEQEFRGPHRVKVWLSSLVHHCWLSDLRSRCVMLEPRVDNEKIASYLLQAGFYKEREISFPHKQSNVMKIKRDAWEGPAL
ncbi:MAG: hypothetical protein M1821_006147 [Bathelium mastoideum]|nr:MAG: hypothetical protein M1821_006147 [Bathelium mastoideum]